MCALPSKLVSLDVCNFSKIIKIPLTDSFVDRLNLNRIKFTVNLEVVKFVAIKACTYEVELLT